MSGPRMLWDLLVWLFAWMLAGDCKDWESEEN